MNHPPDPGQTLAPALPAGDWLAPRDGHRVWWGEACDPAGLPVLVVHGGPGGASRPEPIGWFAGRPVRCLLLDQRGCGRSLPLGETAGNALADLLDDMERLRERLGLTAWALAGGSWGAHVALAYAARHPRRVSGLFLRSPFTATPAETRRYIAAWPDWLGEAGAAWLGTASRLIPAVYRADSALLQADSGKTLDRLAEDTCAARAWSAYDDAQSRPGGVAAGVARFDAARLPEPSAGLMASWRVHLHHAAGAWGAGAAAVPAWPPTAPEGPVAIAWGAADATCDPAVAAALAAAWPAAQAWVADGAGHRMSDAALAPVLRAAAGAWVDRLLLAGRRPAP